MIKSCYIVNFYLGDRRRTVSEFYEDRLCFLKTQIETLKEYAHGLDKIVFCFNIEKEHYHYLTEIHRLVPQKIQEADVDLVVRENIGMSYASFSYCYDLYRNDYEYFFFNEDDYFLVQDNWDMYMIFRFNYFPNTGYYCAVRADAEDWNNYRVHAAHCFGVSSSKILNQVWEKFGCLPHSNINDYQKQEDAQREFSNSFAQLGYNIYDIREDYRLSFAWTENDYDIQRRFWWNEKDLIVPAIIKYDNIHTWFLPTLPNFVRRTNLS